MKKNQKKEKKKTILSKAKIALLAPLLSFIFARSVHGYDIIDFGPPMYAPPPTPGPSPLDIASSVANFFAYILLIPSVLMIAVYIILKKRKSKKKWPKIVLIILISLNLLLFLASFVLPFIYDFLGY